MDTPHDVRELSRRARRNARKAHALYSSYRVGAVLETVDGDLYDGANLENAAYPLGFCAERVALALWRSRSRAPLRRVVVWTESDPPAPPCGLCRDAIAIWAQDAEVWLAGPGGVRGPLFLPDLIPQPMRPNSRGKP